MAVITILAWIAEGARFRWSIGICLIRVFNLRLSFVSNQILPWLSLVIIRRVFAIVKIHCRSVWTKVWVCGL
jgi:hypothetical protein